MELPATTGRQSAWLERRVEHDSDVVSWGPMFYHLFAPTVAPEQQGSNGSCCVSASNILASARQRAAATKRVNTFLLLYSNVIWRFVPICGD